MKKLVLASFATVFFFNTSTNIDYVFAESKEVSVRQKAQQPRNSINKDNSTDLVNKCFTTLEKYGEEKKIVDDYGKKVIFEYTDHRELAIQGHIKPNKFDDDYNKNHHWITLWGLYRDQNNNLRGEAALKFILTIKEGKIIKYEEYPLDPRHCIGRDSLVEKIDNAYQCLEQGKCPIKF